MATETQIGQLVIDLKIKTEALERGLETAKKKIQEIEKQNEQLKSSNSSVDASFIAMSASIIASLVKITSAIDDGVQKYNSYVNSMNALSKTAKATDNSMSDIKNTIEDVNKLKLMDESDLNSSIKNLLLYGYTAEQAADILKVLQDAAVGNRQANYTLSEAVRVTTEGIRMENSVLSDAAGVQKNISKMYQEYAQSIGKTTGSLTQGEKAQAVYNGIMNEASMFTGAAAEMAQGYQGVQSQLNASNLELSRNIGEAMIPSLTQYNSLQLEVTKHLSEFIKNHQGATSGVITFTTTLLAMIVGLTAAKKAYASYKAAATAADMTTKAFTASLLANPITLIAVGVASVVAGLAVFDTKMQESIDKIEEATEKSQNLSEALKNTINNDLVMSSSDQNTIKNAKDEADEIVKIYDEKNKKIEELEKQKSAIIEKYSNEGTTKEKNESVKSINSINSQLDKAKADLREYNLEIEKNGKTIDDYRRKLDTLNKMLIVNEAKQKYATVTNQKAHRETLINIAQTKADIQGKQELLNILKQGKTTTEEYADAKNQLVKVYPELAKVNENTIASTQSAIDAENAAADAEWANAQVAIQASILEVSAMQSNSEQIIQIAIATRQTVEEVTASLQNQIEILGNLAKLTPTDFRGSVTTSYRPKISRASTSSSYQNKALDNYKKQIEHKKALDQLGLQDEINMYETALRSYAKTSDEKWEIEEKIYSLRKELREKSFDDYVADIEHRKSLNRINLQDEINMYQYVYNTLAKTTEQRRELEIKLYELRNELQEKNLNDYISDISRKKALDKISLQDEINMYQYALNNYAKTVEQKNEIRQTLYELNKQVAQKEKELLEEQTEDLETYIKEQKNIKGAAYDINEQTRDYNQIIQIHQDYLKKIMKDERLSLEERKEIYREELQTIRNYEQQKRDLRVQNINNTATQLTNAIVKQLEEMQNKDKEYIDNQLEDIEKLKEFRINAINAEYDAKIEAIEKELEALDKAEQQKSRDEEDAEYERKKRRLEDLVAFEHDATTKANYQKELDKLISEYQKTLDKRTLEDKKEALNEQKDLLKEEQDNRLNSIKEEVERQKETYNKQLENLEEYYNEQIDKAQETAEKMLLNVETNQNQIINLLKSYGNAYEITGQTLGEKLAQGINEGIANKIQNIIQKIQDTIDSNLESKIREWTASSYKYEAGTNKKQSKNVSVIQNNYIQQNPELPSETYRKLRNIEEELASGLAGI